MFSSNAFHLKGRLTTSASLIPSNGGGGCLFIEDSLDRRSDIRIFVGEYGYAEMLRKGVAAATNSYYCDTGGYRADFPLDRYLGRAARGFSVAVGYTLAGDQPVVEWLRVERDEDQPELLPDWLSESLIDHPTLQEDLAEAAAERIEGERIADRELARG